MGYCSGDEIHRKRYECLFEEAPMGYVVCKQNGDFIVVNQTFCQMTGTVYQKHLDGNLMEFVEKGFRKDFKEMFKRVAETGCREAIEISLRGEQGLMDATVSGNRYIGHGVVPGDSFGEGEVLIRCAITDITDLKKRQSEVMHKSLHDPLTGMYNRRFYDEYLVEHDQNSNLPLAVAMIDIDGLKMINDSLGHTFGDRAIISVSKALQKYAKASYLLVRTGGDEIVILFPRTLPDEARSYINRVEETVSGYRLAGISLSFSWGISVKWKEQEDLMTVIAAAEDMMYSKKLLNTAGKKYNTVNLIIHSLFERNKDLKYHCKRVSAMLGAFGRELRLEKEQLIFLQHMGYLHDIGMSSISDEILNKKSSLNAAERREMNRHSEVGYRILRSTPELHELAHAVLYHHENWDGSGFPSGCSGKNIPFEARMTAIVDYYDRRKYGQYGNRAVSEEEILNELRKGAGIRFDPKLVCLFISWREKEERNNREPECIH